MIISFLIVAGPVFSQDPVYYDSSDIEIRHLQYDKIKSYSTQKEFDYREKNAKSLSLWDRFWHWFWEQFYKLAEQKNVQKGFEIFIWIFSISLILFAIYRLAGMERRFFFQRNSGNNKLRFEEEHDDIHSIDFDKAIRDTIEQQNYRLALRLMYLKNLKLLSDKNLIQFRLDKTNFDYAGELRNTPFADGFTDTTMVYEYAWYGEFPVAKEQFERLAAFFYKYENTISI